MHFLSSSHSRCTSESDRDQGQQASRQDKLATPSAIKGSTAWRVGGVESWLKMAHCAHKCVSSAALQVENSVVRRKANIRSPHSLRWRQIPCAISRLYLPSLRKRVFGQKIDCAAALDLSLLLMLDRSNASCQAIQQSNSLQLLLCHV